MMSLEINSGKARILYKTTTTTTTIDNQEGGSIIKAKEGYCLKSYKKNRSKKDSFPVGESGNIIDKCKGALYRSAVCQILQTISDLEQSLLEDHQQDYKLHMALERQTEKVLDLRTTLTSEKKRNQRLLNLIGSVDSAANTDDEDINRDERLYKNFNSISEAFGSISPLLLQQRYDELSISYKQCRHQLVKKEKLLTLCNCEKEILQAKYEQLMDEHRLSQKRFEDLCSRYLHLQKRKNYEIQQLRETLTYASDCVISAQQIVDSSRGTRLEIYTKEFNQNLQLFIKSLEFCEWTQCKCSSISSQVI